MFRTTLFLLVAAITVAFLGPSGSALAGGGHRHHGHHHHSGFHLHIGLGSSLHHRYHHHHYYRYPYSSYRYYSPYYTYGSYYRPYYGYYNYSCPTYYTYGYYGLSTRPHIVYLMPSGSSTTKQQPVEPTEKPKVDPPPPVVPSDELPKPDSTQRAGDRFQLVNLSSSSAQGQTTEATAGNLRPSGDGSSDSELGPQLSVPKVRSLVSDEEAPWVVEDQALPNRGIVARR